MNNDTSKRLQHSRIRRITKKGITYLFLILLGIIMVYPLLWIVSASFKTNNEIFSSLSLIPKVVLLDGYSKGWAGVGQNSFALFFANTFIQSLHK